MHGWQRRRDRGQFSSIVVISEGALPARARTPSRPGRATMPATTDQFGHARLGGIGNWLAGEVESRTASKHGVTALGHLQRGSTPTAFDRMLATRFGVAAVAAAHDGDFGQMVALQAGEIVRVPLKAVITTPRTLISPCSGSGGPIPQLTPTPQLNGRASVECAGSVRARPRA